MLLKTSNGLSLKEKNKYPSGNTDRDIFLGSN